MTTTTAQAKRIAAGRKLYWEPNLSVWIRAQPANENYAITVEYNGEPQDIGSPAESRDEAARILRDLLERLGLEKTHVDTLLGILSHDEKGKRLKGIEYPSSTLHVTVA